MYDNRDELFRQLSEKLGTSSERLRSAADTGDLSGVLNSSGNPNAARVKQVLDDPEHTKKLLQSPEAQRLMKLLNGETEK